MMRRILRSLTPRSVRAPLAAAGLMAALAATTAATAQDMATLVADSLRIEADQRLVAEGNVEVLYQGVRLRARRIVYDDAAGTVNIEGPMTLVQDENAVLIAEGGQISTDLREGVLRSARFVMNQQLQIAANEIIRADGRYTQASRTVASSCEVCPGGRQVPLWEIRAERVLHDQQEHRIYFDRAQFRIAGIPVAYIPRLKLPDPTVKRERGFLPPSFVSSSELGTGLKVPYFIPLGERRDLTVTPFVSSKRAEMVELRYREAYRNGWMEATGAVARDEIYPRHTRYFLFANGRFRLPQDFVMRFDLQISSDPAFLLDYDYTERDRLVSDIVIDRARRDEYIGVQLFHYYSLRDQENNSTLASVISDGIWERRYELPGPIGGFGNYGLETHSHMRSSDIDYDADGDGEIDGRDMSRLSLFATWRREWLLQGGLVLAGMADLRGHAYWIADDTTADDQLTRIVPTIATELRWPLVKSTRGRALQTLEPVAQLVWTPKQKNTVPNEDSQLVEFDETNLFALNRFPGADAYEQGLRANLGLRWTRIDPEGWTFGVTVGRVLRADDLGQFTDASGLDGTSSDWLAAFSVDWRDGVQLTNRALFDDDLTFSKNEVRLDWSRGRLDMATSFIWMEADIVEKRPDETSEWAMDAGWRFNDSWRGTTHWRYDFAAERAARAGFGVAYRNECVAVDLSLSRRFTTSTSVTPSTRFSLSVELAGFGSGDNRPALRRNCTG